MASQVLSGANNASYTNNTGQNVRLIINYMSNVTSMTWAGVSVTAESTTIGKDIQNITGEFRRIKIGKELGPAVDANLVNSGVKIYELDTELATGIAGYFLFGPQTIFWSRIISEVNKIARKAWGTSVSDPSIQIKEFGFSGPLDQTSPVHYIPKTISRGGDFPTELMLANGESFSSVCGAYNAIVIKEDGT
jgi:hypothetical protein